MRAVRSQKPSAPSAGGGGQQAQAGTPQSGPYASGSQRLEGATPALAMGGRRQPLESIQLPEAFNTSPHSPLSSPEQRVAGRSAGLEEREAELEGLIAEYEEAVEGLNQDREVLQQEVQRVLQLERQREEELSHAVSVNQTLNEEISELRESISKGGEALAQKTLLRQLESQVEALQYERDKALLEVDSLYAEVQSLQSQSPTRNESPSKNVREKHIPSETYAQLEQEVLDISKDLEHGYKVMEALRDEGDEFSTQVRMELRGLSKEKDQMSRAVADINGKLRFLLPESWTESGGESDEVLLRKVADLEKKLRNARDDSTALESALKQVQETDAKLQEARQTCTQLEIELEDSRRAAAENSSASRICGADGSDASDGAAAECERLRHQIDDLLDELEDVRNELREKDEELKTVQGEAAGSAEERERLMRDVDNLENTLAKEREELAVVREEVEELKAEAEERKGESNSAEELEALQGALMDMKMKLEGATGSARDREAEFERDVATLEARLRDEVAQREATQRALSKMMENEEEKNWKEKAEELQRKLVSARGMEEAHMGTIKGLNDRVRELEEEAEASRREAGAATAKVSKLEAAVEDVSEELNSAIIERDEMEGQVSVLTRQLDAANSLSKELRRSLKGSGMLSKSQADALVQQLEEVQGELQAQKEASATAAEDKVNAVKEEVETLVQALSEAKHLLQNFVHEETQARQLLERHVRRNIADLQATASTLHQEVQNLMTSPVSSPSSQRRGFHSSLPSPRTDTALEDRVRDLEIRNRQLEQQARLLMTASREFDVIEKDRIVREAEKVWAESESRLWSTLQDQEEQFRQQQHQQRTQAFPNQHDDEGHRYRRLRSRVEELETRLLGSVRQLEVDRGKGGDGEMQQQMGQLVAAQRDVQEALKALAAAQTGLQEQQRQLTSRQEREQREAELKVRRPREVVTPSTPPSPQTAWVPFEASPAPWSSAPLTVQNAPPSTVAPAVFAYMDYATPSPAPQSPVHYANGWSATGPLVSTPTSGISFATLNKFAPPSWRAAYGLAPVEVRSDQQQAHWIAGGGPSSAHVTPHLISGRSKADARSVLHGAAKPSAAKQLIDATMQKLNTAVEVPTASPPSGADVASAPSSAYLISSNAVPTSVEDSQKDD